MRSMATMSMNRVIHGAIRRDLERFEGALTTFRDGDGERARQLGAAWENFDTQLTDHHEGEHEIAWPALQSVGVSKELLATIKPQHWKYLRADNGDLPDGWEPPQPGTGLRVLSSAGGD